MRRKKLGNYGVILIILAGFFQLITLSLDQYVIQIEENNRTIIEKISNHSNERNYSLENNRLIGTIKKINGEYCDVDLQDGGTFYPILEQVYGHGILVQLEE